MKIQCPYCNELSAWKKNQCPVCHKFAITPGFFRKSSKGTSGRRERDLGIATPWLMTTGGFYNIGIILRSIPRWVLVLGGIAVIGSFWHASNLKPDYSQSIQLTQDNLSILNIALDAFKKDCGRFPVTDEGLAALVAEPRVEGWKGPYVFKLKPDPWKQPFSYVSDGSTMKLFSAGPDKRSGTADDILAPAGQGALMKELRSGEIDVSIGTSVSPQASHK